MIAVGLCWVFIIDDMLNHIFDRFIRYRLTAARFVAWGEEIFKGKYAVWRADIFIGDCATDGCLMYADGLGDCIHRKWAQLSHTNREKIAL